MIAMHGQQTMHAIDAVRTYGNDDGLALLGLSLRETAGIMHVVPQLCEDSHRWAPGKAMGASWQGQTHACANELPGNLFCALKLIPVQLAAGVHLCKRYAETMNLIPNDQGRYRTYGGQICATSLPLLDCQEIVPYP